MYSSRKTGVGLALAGLGAALVAMPAHASSGFTGSYASNNFVTREYKGSITFTASTLTLTNGTGTGLALATIESAPASGIVSFTYTATGPKDFFVVTRPIGGGQSKSIETLPLSASPGSGTVQQSIQAGDLFSFFIQNPVFNSTPIPSTLLITNFSAPAATPEPSSIASMGIGLMFLGGLILRARKRRSVA